MTETVAEQNLESGKICRVSGPIVEAEGMERAMMYEVVEVGPDGLIGEVIKVSGGRATIQVYEHTGGLEPGMEVKRKGRPLSLQLGPGMLGGIYDGIQHPLGTFQEKLGPFIKRGAKAFPLDKAKEWEFEANVEEGDNVEEGQIFGTVQETESIEHRLMVPRACAGKVTHIRETGEYTVEEIVCVIQAQDGEEYELDMVQVWPCREARPFGERLRPTEPLITGQRVLDTMFPIVRGGSAAVPGDFGTGKTVVQQQLAKWSDADVVIYVGCGERGNEMTDILRVFPDLQDPRTGRSLMERTVLIANTSNMPVAAREISIYSGVTVAEYFRDMGYDVALMADSTSRWAEALREVSSRLEEMPAEEGFPAYLSKRLAEFYERAGFVETLGGDKGSVTVVGSVSPPAGDFSEPVTQHTKRFVRCFWVLDRDLAYARHFPAVNWDQSYSEYVDEIADWWGKIESDWASLRRDGINLLQEYDRLQEIVKLVGRDVLPDEQRLSLLCAETLKRGFLQQDAFNDVDSFCDPKRQAAFLRAIMTFYRRAKEIISAGAPIMRLQELDVVGELQRARFHIENEDEEGLQELNDKVRKQLDELEANYQ